MNPNEIVPSFKTCKELAALRERPIHPILPILAAYLLGAGLVCFCIFCAPDAVKNAPVIKTLPFKHEV